MMPIDDQKRNNYIFTKIGDTITGIIATYQTGSLPVVSTQRNSYIFILYYYDSNAILAGQ